MLIAGKLLTVIFFSKNFTGAFNKAEAFNMVCEIWFIITLACYKKNIKK